MRLKNPLFTVMCLVILHSAAAQCDSISNEASVSNITEKIEQKIMRKLETHLELHSTHVIEKLAALTTKVQQIADSNQNLSNITDNFLVEQEKANEKEFHKFQNSTNAQHEEVIEKLATLTTNVQQMEESINNLRNIADNLVASQSHVEKQLTKMEKEGMIPVSCTNLNINETGTYSIRPFGVTENFLAFCDFKDFYNLGGGWTVFQRRLNGTVNFYQNWTMYKNGFGDVNGEHWLGLEKLHLMTRWGRHELLVILKDHEGGSAYARYDSFQIGSEAEKYKLTIGKYSGTAGNSLDLHNGMNFSTFDQDNGTYDGNCAKEYNGAWWYSSGCFSSHLNGKYRRKGEHINYQYQGVIWYHWKRTHSYSLKSTKMMLRRRSG